MSSARLIKTQAYNRNFTAKIIIDTGDEDDLKNVLGVIKNKAIELKGRSYCVDWLLDLIRIIEN